MNECPVVCSFVSYSFFLSFFRLSFSAKEAVILAFPPSERLPVTPQGTLVAPGPSQDVSHLSFLDLKQLLVSLGVVPGGVGAADGDVVFNTSSRPSIPVLVDGRVLGSLPSAIADEVVAQLRFLKVSGGLLHEPKTRLDPTTELAFIPPFKQRKQGSASSSSLLAGGAYPGLYIFTQAGRMIRPVTHLGTGETEWIGPMEQVYMEVACLTDDMREGETTHAELSPDVMLSQVAFLTPYSDCNQSPRNMYQCQVRLRHN